ncbi:MAG TPA: MFS transporter [Caldilineaceae bacterium]|nr:MFS transporter [Caldilineaceae bacterium]
MISVPDTVVDAGVQAAREAEANAPWNFTVNLLDILLITLGFSLISRETVMPVLVSTLTDSKLAVGLVAAIFGFGFYLPQLLTAGYTEQLRYKKPFVMTVSLVGERLPYLLIALAVWGLAARAPALTLVLFYLCLATAAFSAGAATPAWLDIIAKVIPVRRRGLWSGLGHSLGALLGVVGALLAGRILAGYPYPTNYALLFGLASVFIFLSWVGLALNREPPSVVTKEAIPLRVYFRQLPAVLRRNLNYRAYLLSRMTVLLGAMANGFFIVYGRERFGIDAAGIGALTALLVGSVAVMNLVWGFLADRWGHKLVLAGGALLLALAGLNAWLAPSAAWLGLTFVLLGAYSAADMVSSLTIILEFCAPEDRPTYIGLTNTLLAPILILAPVLGGWLATVAGYTPLLITSTTIAAIGGLLLVFWVHEPRTAPLVVVSSAEPSLFTPSSLETDL